MISYKIFANCTLKKLRNIDCNFIIYILETMFRAIFNVYLLNNLQVNDKKITLN